jgi:4-azaleucine resistance transporter AzlC
MDTILLSQKSSDLRRGMQAGLSIAIGYMPIALTFGLLAKSTGLSIYETTLMSLLVFAGAAQYISLNLISLGTGVFEIILTTAIVNIRHFLMSASLNEKMEEDNHVVKAFYSFGITDETFSITSVKEGTVTTQYLIGVIVVSYSSWVVNTYIGHLIGASLPTMLQESMGIALYAMFVGLLVPSLKKQRKVVFLAGIAAIINLSLMSVMPPSWTGWAIVTSTLLSAIGTEFLFTKIGGKRNG